MSNQIKKLKQSLMNPEGLNVFFIVIVVAFGLMLYELGMFYFIITPKIKNQISDSIKDIGKSIRSSGPSFNLDKLMPVLNASKKQVDNVLEIMDEREELLTSKINNYTKVTGIFILLGLAIILLLINNKLKSTNEHVHRKTLFLCLYTFVLIMGFQFFFYYYGQNFFYSSDKELTKYLLTKL
jgi:preprotein translocase subunit SecY